MRSKNGWRESRDRIPRLSEVPSPEKGFFCAVRNTLMRKRDTYKLLIVMLTPEIYFNIRKFKKISLIKENK